jgi:hypothetical protein
MERELGFHRKFISNYNEDTIELLKKLQEYSNKYGIDETDRCHAPASVDLYEKRFIKNHNIAKESFKKQHENFYGDHCLVYSNNNNILNRSDEYPLSFDEITKRIEIFKKSGLDGYITGRSLHFPTTTFGIVAYPKGKYEIEGI